MKDFLAKLNDLSARAVGYALVGITMGMVIAFWVFVIFDAARDGVH